MRNTKKDVVGIGALNWDYLYYVEKYLGPGEEDAIERVERLPGGSAANTIVGLARLGCKTGFIGIVDNKDEGKEMKDDLEREKVDTSQICKASGLTGRVVGIVDRRGERALYVYPGVNNKLAMQDIEPYIPYLENSAYIHMSSFVHDNQFNLQRELVKKLPDSTKISFVPGNLYCKKKWEELESILKKTYVIFLDIHEANLITQEFYPYRSQNKIERFGIRDLIKELQKRATVLLDVGVKVVVITLGKSGCFVATKDNQKHVSVKPLNAVDTTGAGDALAAGFIYGLLKGKDEITSAKLGNDVARFCIQEKGARKGLPNINDLYKTPKLGEDER